jgi:gluconokinase
MKARLPIVVMGVCASGKSHLGAALAARLKLAFVDGDDLHSAHNIDKMSHGEPLSDEDRRPWLGAIAARLADARTYPDGIVIACSALKLAYRQALRCAPGTRFVFLDATRDLIHARMQEREHHFMPPRLLESQFATLERPTAAESDVVILDASRAVEENARVAVRLLAVR